MFSLCFLVTLCLCGGFFQQPARALPLPLGIETFPDCLQGRVVIEDHSKIDTITEKKLTELSAHIPTCEISAQDAKKELSDSEYRAERITSALSKVDLDLNYYLVSKKDDHAYNQVKVNARAINIYEGPAAQTHPIGSIELPALLTIINKQGDMLKIRLSSNDAGWVNVKEIDSKDLEERLSRDIHRVELQLEAREKLQRCYYTDEMGDRAGWASLGILGSLALLADGANRAGSAPFSGRSEASLAQNTGAVLGAVEIIGGLYIGWNSIAYLFTPQEKFVYQKSTAAIDDRSSNADDDENNSDDDIDNGENADDQVVTNELLQLLNELNGNSKELKKFSADIETVYVDSSTQTIMKGLASFAAPDTLQIVRSYPDICTMVRKDNKVYYSDNNGQLLPNRKPSRLIPQYILDPVRLSKKLHYTLYRKDNGIYVLSGIPRSKKGMYSSKNFSKFEYEITERSARIKTVRIYRPDDSLFLKVDLAYTTIDGIAFPEKITGTMFVSSEEFKFETFYRNVQIN